MVEIAIRIRRACGFWGRSRGLLGRPAPARGEALLLEPCRQVHTLFMAYAIDVAHLDGEGVVLAVETLAPWRLGRWVWGAAGVLELAAGEAARVGLSVGVRPRLIDAELRVTRGCGQG